MSQKRKIVKIDEEKCDGCGQCVISCAEGALKIINGKARMVSESYCDGLGACLGECPQGAITIEERIAAEFDEEAVKVHLTNLEKEKSAATQPNLPCGCPGSAMRTITHTHQDKHRHEKMDTRGEHVPSALSTWPVQLKLVPPTAPFLQHADLLISADCVPFAYANFHGDFVDGKVVLVGCPKLDDLDYYRQKLSAIFASAQPKSVTVLRMEVPCCSGIVSATKEALEIASPGTPLEISVIGINGEIIESERLVTDLCSC